MDVLHEIDFGNGYSTESEPENFDSAEVDIIFTKDLARANLANLTLVFKGATAKKIFDEAEKGKNGGKGVAHALPYRITVCGTGLQFYLMLVLGHSTARFSCDQVEVPAWQAQGADWLEKETQGYSFWHLYKNVQTGQPGKINFSDFKKTPYTVNSIPNYTQVVSLSFQELILIWKLRELVLAFTDNSTEISADVGESAVPVVGTPHIIVTVTHVLRLVIRIAEIIGYLILIAKFAKDLKENFVQDKKYKLCMREKDLFQKMCDFLKIPFSSPIYAPGSKFENATWMPSKIVMPKVNQPTFLNNLVSAMFDRPENEVNNPKSFGYFDGLFAEFIETMERKYNAEGRMVNGAYVFKNVNDWNTSGAYQIPNTGEVGYTLNLPGPYRTNLSQLAPYYEVSFRIDQSELNTIHRYRGTSAAVQILSPFPVSKYSGWGQSQLIDLGSSLAKRKYYLTREEDFINRVFQVFHTVVNVVIAPINALISVVNGILSVINGIISIFGGGLNTIPLINKITNPIPLNIFASRLGWMELSGDSFSVPKTFIGIDIGGDWEIHPASETNMSAATLLNDAHGSNLATRGNQYFLYDNNRSRLCCQDFSQIFLKNILITPDKKPGKFLSMKWNLKKELAREIDYKVKETYLTGLTEKLIIDGTP